MKHLLLTLFLLISCRAFGQSHMTVMSRDNRVGYATISQNLQPDGSKVVQFRLQLENSNQMVTITNESRFSSDGLPVRKFVETLVKGSPSKQQVATFNNEGAHVVTNEAAGRKVKDVPLVEAASRSCTPEFWFIRDKPIKGDVVRSYVFNMDKLEWQLSETTYKGKKEIKIGKKTYSANVVVEVRDGKTTTSYLDDAGLPILISSGDLKLSRIDA